MNIIVSFNKSFARVVHGSRFYSDSHNIMPPKPGLCKPGDYLGTRAKLMRGIWPWEQGIRARLPDHFKHRYMEQFLLEPLPVHYKVDTRKYTLDEWGLRRKVQNIPIPVVYPTLADEGLWGGEGIIEGMRQKDNRFDKPRYSRIWKPSLRTCVFYSEILDNWMSILVTDRTLSLIDEAYGFDFYILKTHEVDMKSKFGMKLKRMMIRALIHKSFHSNDAEKRKYVYEKYKDFIIPEEEVDWLGLDIHEAEKKQQDIEERERLSVKPMKQKYLAELLSELQTGKSSGEEQGNTWLRKLSPFQDSKGSKEN